MTRNKVDDVACCGPRRVPSKDKLGAYAYPTLPPVLA